MFESKYSTVRSMVGGGDFSTIQSSSAPGFVPIPCPSHSQYAITNICKSPSCLQPLCPECITAHVQLHQQTKKPAKIENIISTRLTVIEQLAQLKYEADQQLSKQKEEINGNIDRFVEDNQKKLSIAKKKVLKMVEEMFEEHFRRLDVIASAFHIQKDKRNKQYSVKLAPLIDYCEKIANYKQEMESEDYIPALLELLNEPPRRPAVGKRTPIENCGSVQINEKHFEDIKSSMEKFVKVTLIGIQNTTVALNRSNYHNSNNMKFSRMEQSRSSESRLQLSRQNSKKKIFESSVSEIRPVTANLQSTSQKGAIRSFSNVVFNPKLQASAEIQQGMKYFRSEDQAVIAYFQESTKTYFKANLEYAEAGFEKIPLQIDFLIPKKHRSLVTPDSQIFMIGGQTAEGSSCKVFRVKKYYQHMLEEGNPMNQPRQNFAACHYNNSIFVFGGLSYGNRNPDKSFYNLLSSNASGAGNKFSNTQTPSANSRALKKCQRYDYNENKWQQIDSLPESCYDFQVCAFNDKIIKFGGTLESGQKLHRIDIYYPEVDLWNHLKVDQGIPLLCSMGVCQISSKQMMIFGGSLPGSQGRVFKSSTNSTTSKSYILSENSTSNALEVSESLQLYQESSFDQAYLFKGSMIAIQNNDNKQKVIMSYKNKQWRFVGC